MSPDTKRITASQFFNLLQNMEDTVFRIEATNRFRKSVERSHSRSLDLSDLLKVIHTLAKGEKLDKKHHPHALSGYSIRLMECHIKPDWLLVWQQNDKEVILILLDTGTHSDLF